VFVIEQGRTATTKDKSLEKEEAAGVINHKRWMLQEKQ
jgi:hypothetical protein